MLGLPVLAGVCWIAAAPAPATDSEEQLVRDVLALRNGPLSRTTHVAPALPGTFGELAVPFLIALEISRKRIGAESAEQVENRRAVERGQKPTSTLRPEWTQELAATKEALEGMLRATHAAGAKTPYLLSIFGVFGADDDRYSGATVQHALKLGALRARSELEAKDTKAAVQTCADGLGMARDVAYSSLIGQMLASAMVKVVEPVCRDTARVASSTEQETLKNAIALIIAGWPTLRDTLHVEILFGQLGLFFDQLSDYTKAQLPPEARLKVTRIDRGWFGRAQRRVFGGLARQKHLAQMRALMDAVDLPPRQAEVEADRIFLDDFAFTLAGMNDGTKSAWVPMLRRVRTTLAYVARLGWIVQLEEFHTTNGRWPTDWQETGVAQPIDPRTSLPFFVRAASSGIVLSMQTDGARTGDNLDVELK